jgi:hypothetical protein
MQSLRGEWRGKRGARISAALWLADVFIYLIIQYLWLLNKFHLRRKNPSQIEHF